MAAKNEWGLTDQQLKFADLLLADPHMNATKAYQEAYPSCKTVKAAESGASRLLSNAKVEAYLSYRRTELQKAVHVTQEAVLLDIIALKEMCLGRTASPLVGTQEVIEIFDDGNGGKVPISNKQMVEINIRKLDSAGAGKALEMLGKYLKMFTDKVEHSGHLETVTDDELDARIAALIAETGAAAASGRKGKA